MKIIISRKGTDSAAGGIPAPILPDGRLLSLPIPQKGMKPGYADLSFDGLKLSRIMSQLGGKGARGGCHLDPDLIPTLKPRLAGWQPTLVQFGAVFCRCSGRTQL